MRILLVGDIFARAGRSILKERLPGLLRQHSVDLCVVNGENASGGIGITLENFHEICAAGADAVTLGNHTWGKREVFGFIDSEPRLLRPANFPPGTPGQGATIVQSRSGERVLVVNLMGRVYSPVALECPFRHLDAILDDHAGRYDAVVVDFHAEATSEKVALGWYADGRVTVLAGTHTHVPTADTMILPKGTAYQTDLGMTGPYHSVIGMQTEIVLQKFLTQLPVRFEAANGPRQLCGLLVETDGLNAKEVARILIREE